MSGRWTLLAALVLTACGHENTLDPIDTGERPVGPQPEVNVPTILINEVMADNESTINGPDGSSFPDWVEIVNASEEPVDTRRIRVESEDGGWEGAGELVLQPGDRMIIWFDEERDKVNPWAGVRLGKTQDFVIAFVDGVATDQVDIIELGEDVSLARTPDIIGDLVPTAWPTPGEINQPEPSPTLDPGDETLFIPGKMHKIQFIFTPQNLQAIDGGDRPVVHAEAIIDGVRYRDIGVGLKGSASYDPMSKKPAFKVKLNEWIKGTRFRGQRAFGLHNGMVLDPTRTRDFMTYKLARTVGLMAPRVGWAEVWANQDYLGLYMIIERFEEEFIEYRRPGHGELGFVFEGNTAEGGGWASDFGSWGVVNFDQEEGPRPLPAQVQNSMQQINDIIKSNPSPSDATMDELFKYLNKPQFLTYMAWESVVNHTDGYKAPNNWRFYVDPVTYKVEWMPAGAEWTWDFAPNVYSFGGAVASYCLKNAKCKRDYSIRLLEVAKATDQLKLLDTYYQLTSFLGPYIDKDPRYYNKWGGGGLEAARASTIDKLKNNTNSVRQQVKSAYPDL